MVKTGFIGFGRMGITHFSILNTHPLVKIAAVCDTSSTMLNILKRYIEIHTYNDYRKMIEREGLDAVVVSTPTDSHSQILDYAIDNDLHIFVEKPFAMAPVAGRDTLTRLDGKPLVNQVGYVNRFNEVFIEVKKLLDAGLIGEIKNFSSEMYGATVLKDSKSSWRGRGKAGGGCMYEFASHGIDLVVYLMGPPDRVIGSVVQKIFSSDVEDLVSSTFLYDNGVTGNLMINWSDETYRKPTNIIRILGSRGKIIVDKHAFKVFLKESSKELDFQKGWNTRYITEFAQGVRFYVRGNEFTRQLDYFVDSIEEGRAENICSFSEAFKTDIIMQQIRTDAARTYSEDRGGGSVSSLAKKPQKRGSLWSRIVRRVEEYNA